MTDAYALVLHSHLPYVRGAGRWPHGEEWVHEAILGTYLPLLVMLHDLRADGIRYRVTIGLTPTLIEQLADRDINARFLEYVDDQIRRAELDAWDLASADADRAALAEFYRTAYAGLKEAYVTRFWGDIVGAFVDLARTGQVEILTSAATHGYLPLLDDRSVRTQLAVGRMATRRLTGLLPTGIWLPECAYRPGLERALEAEGFTHFFTDADLFRDRDVTGAPRRFGTSWPIRSGGAVATEDPTLVDQTAEAAGRADVLRPYLVADSAVAAIARHPEVSGQVWSAATGYPGDPAYREFHRKDDRTGLRYWSVTAATVELGAKAPYRVAAAAARVRVHAAHFAERVRLTLHAHRAATGRAGLLTTTFDSELFGHWWFEGVSWLGLVLRALGPLTTTAAEWLAVDPPGERVALAEGSWGKRNDHSTWRNPDTEWMWDELRSATVAIGTLAGTFAAGSRPDGLRPRAADQALRELLLLESSDWPFLVSTGQAADYGAERFRAHALRLRRCVELAGHGGTADDGELRSLERADAIFPDARIAMFGRGSG